MLVKVHWLHPHTSTVFDTVVFCSAPSVSERKKRVQSSHEPHCWNMQALLLVLQHIHRHFDQGVGVDKELFCLKQSITMYVL